jgi:hypothetical protein
VTVGSGAPTPSANNAAFVSQSVPTVMNPGQSYSVLVRMRNTGTTTWNTSTYRLGSQNPQDNTTWGASRLGLAAAVAPGSDATFSFTVKAPSTPGSYSFQWQMVENSAGFFGSASANVVVSVGSTASTLTITTTSIPYPTRGVFYNAQLRASGGLPSYTWFVAAGALPPGLALNSSTGALSGTPTVVGTYYFTIGVRDSSNKTATRAYKTLIR